MLAVLGLIVHAIVRLFALGQGAVSFADVALSTFLIIQVFNLVDLLIIDWLVVVTLQPALLTVPGTKGMRGPDAYLFHFHAFLKGVAGSLLASLLIAGITMLSVALLG